MNEKTSREVLNELKHINMNLQALTNIIKEKDTTAPIASCYNFCDKCPYYKQNSEGDCTYGKICQRIIAAYQEEKELAEKRIRAERLKHIKEFEERTRGKRATSSVIDDEFRLEDDGK